MKVRITKGTCGAFRMAYFAGMEADLPTEQAKLLIESGYAEQIEEIIETATQKTASEIPEKKRKK